LTIALDALRGNYKQKKKKGNQRGIRGGYGKSNHNLSS